MGWEADTNVYDELHSTAEAHVPVNQSLYYPLFQAVVREVRRSGPARLLEVGCGSGGLAQMLVRAGREPELYRGFDFSKVGVANAIARLERPDLFFVANALDPASYDWPYDAIICTEVLEHINDDLGVIRLWRPGALCICSVPNFDYATHVRHFRSEEDVLGRYGELIDIEVISRVAKPVLRGLTVSEYLRRLRWAADNPRRLLGLLGFRTFDYVAGWFVFRGRRRA